jgi:hypothetical protein
VLLTAQQREEARLAQLTAQERERARIAKEAEAAVTAAIANQELNAQELKEVERLRQAYIEAATAASSILNPVVKAKDATELAAEAAKKAAEEYQKMLAKIIEASPELRRLGFDVENLKSTFEMVESSMEDAFMSIVDGTAKGQDAFKAMAAAIIKDLYRVLVVQRLVGTFESGTGIAGFIGRPVFPALLLAVQCRQASHMLSASMGASCSCLKRLAAS